MSALDNQERYWRDKQPWLLSCGYQLRARYQPDWIPSWDTNPAANYHVLRGREDFATRGVRVHKYGTHMLRANKH
jgi:hypothetical protein